MTILDNDYTTHSTKELILTTAPLIIAYHLEPFVTEYITYKICDNYPTLTMCSTENSSPLTITGVASDFESDIINICP